MGNWVCFQGDELEVTYDSSTHISYPIGLNLVTWPHLAAKETGKSSLWLGGQLKLAGF